jgi:uncharacterized ferritin-like protein (DUF455 family)
MEIREWASRILSADRIEDKLFDPVEFTDHIPGEAIYWKEPVRPPGLALLKKSKKEKLPPFHEHHDAEKRATCLHRFAGHELLAVEIMAYTLLAFPEAPRHFRRGLVNTLRDEQRHVSLYINRMKAMGLNFGDLPLYKHFWVHSKYITSPLRYVSTMCLTLEMANLDFAPMYGKSFLKYEDQESSNLMATILKDEISHVNFGLQWLRKFKPSNESDWDTWNYSKSDLMTPKRAKGFIVHEENRRLAGVPQDWIEMLKKS